MAPAAWQQHAAWQSCGEDSLTPECKSGKNDDLPSLTANELMEGWTHAVTCFRHQAMLSDDETAASCSMCDSLARDPDQSWPLVLDSLQIPRELALFAAKLMDRRGLVCEVQTCASMQPLLSLADATGQLVSNAYSGSGSRTLTGLTLARQLASSGLFEVGRLPHTLRTAATYVAGSVRESTAPDELRCTQVFIVMAVQFLQLYLQLCYMWPGGILTSAAAGPCAVPALELAVAVIKHGDSMSSYMEPPLLQIARQTSVNLVLQLTHPLAAGLADAALCSRPHVRELTAAPCLLPAVILALAMQSQWLLQHTAAAPDSSQGSRQQPGSSSSSTNRSSQQHNPQRAASTGPQGEQLPSPLVALLRLLGLEEPQAGQLAPVAFDKYQPTQQDVRQFILLYKRCSAKARETIPAFPVAPDRQQEKQGAGNQQGSSSSSRQLAAPHKQLMQLQLLMPVALLSTAARFPADYGLVIAAASAAQEALSWWQMMFQNPSLISPQMQIGTVLSILDGVMKNALPDLAQAMQQVQQQPDASPAAAAAAGGGGEDAAATKVAALTALAVLLSSASDVCSCLCGRLTPWREVVQPLAAALEAALCCTAREAAASAGQEAEGLVAALVATEAEVVAASRDQALVGCTQAVLSSLYRCRLSNGTAAMPMPLLRAAVGAAAGGSEQCQLFALLLRTAKVLMQSRQPDTKALHNVAAAAQFLVEGLCAKPEAEDGVPCPAPAAVAPWLVLQGRVLVGHGKKLAYYVQHNIPAALAAGEAAAGKAAAGGAAAGGLTAASGVSAETCSGSGARQGPSSHGDAWAAFFALTGVHEAVDAAADMGEWLSQDMDRATAAAVQQGEQQQEEQGEQQQLQQQGQAHGALMGMAVWVLQWLGIQLLQLQQGVLQRLGIQLLQFALQPWQQQQEQQPAMQQCMTGAGYDLQQCRQQLQQELLPVLLQARRLATCAVTFAAMAVARTPDVEKAFLDKMSSAVSLRSNGPANSVCSDDTWLTTAQTLREQGIIGDAVYNELCSSGSAACLLPLLQQGAVAALPQQLEAFGSALCAQLPVRHCCNNPGCRNLAGPGELVGGKSCICAGCQVARYCGKQCQTDHWKLHRPVCRRLKAAAEAAADATAAVS